MDVKVNSVYDSGILSEGIGQTPTFIIIKEVINEYGVVVPVILLDGSDEVLEFTNEDNAHATARLFEYNSECGWKYKVKRI